MHVMIAKHAEKKWGLLNVFSKSYGGYSRSGGIYSSTFYGFFKGPNLSLAHCSLIQSSYSQAIEVCNTKVQSKIMLIGVLELMGPRYFTIIYFIFILYYMYQYLRVGIFMMYNEFASHVFLYFIVESCNLNRNMYKILWVIQCKYF